MVVAPKQSSLFVSDEELGKRDDDHKPSKIGTWNIKHRPTWRKRRIAGVAALGLLVWLFIHYIPTDLGPRQRLAFPQPRAPREPPRAVKQAEAELQDRQAEGERLSRTPKVLQTQGDGTPSQGANFNGPVKFYQLASTLREAGKRGSRGEENRNVLFAASDLSSAAAIIPIACEMGSWRRNLVHIAIMGTSETPLDTIQHINGATEESCHVSWHDARPDYAGVSSHSRMQTSVAGAIGHIGKFLQPVVVVTAELEDEDSFFALGLGKKVREKRLTHIQIPKQDPEKLRWLARLDAAGLSNWHSATFDIMVQAPLDSAGSLIRLLKSLSTADYSGFTPPRLVLELPHKVDKVTESYLRGFQWPPFPYRTVNQPESLIVHKRITEPKSNPAEASLRFIESFFPSSTRGPHALILSPQVELSPAYFHYLKAHMLEYKHAGHSMGTSRDLFGISLEAPSRFLNGSRFVMPDTDPGTFRWQAPNSHAALYFSDKYIEAHSFLMKRHTAAFNPRIQGYLQDQAHLVTSDSPAWVEYFLEFMRNRGWSLHYPAIPTDDSPSAIAVVHNELYQPPEEFSGPEETPTWENMPPPSESVLTVRDEYLSSYQQSSSSSSVPNTEGPLITNLDSILPIPPPRRPPTEYEDHNMDMSYEYLQDPSGPQPLPALSSLPLLDHLGEVITTDTLLIRAEAMRKQYRQAAGGCSLARTDEKEAEMYPFQAEDLFCFDERRRTEAEGMYDPSRPSTTKDELHGGDGAAAAVNRVTNPDRYQETAKAGMKAKIDREREREKEREDFEHGNERALAEEVPSNPRAVPAAAASLATAVAKAGEEASAAFPRLSADHPALDEATAADAQAAKIAQGRQQQRGARDSRSFSDHDDEFMRLAAPGLGIKGRRPNNKPVREPPVRERPVREQPVREQPIREQPTQEQPIRGQPIREQPTREQPTRNQPANPQPPPNDPITNDPSTKQSQQNQPQQNQPPSPPPPPLPKPPTLLQPGQKPDLREAEKRGKQAEARNNARPNPLGMLPKKPGNARADSRPMSEQLLQPLKPEGLPEVQTGAQTEAQGAGEPATPPAEEPARQPTAPKMAARPEGKGVPAGKVGKLRVGDETVPEI